MHSLSPDALTTFWDLARRSSPDLPAQPPPPDRVWGFGATPAHADTLLRLVLEGTKTGTSGSLWDYRAAGEEVTRVGDLDVILDGAGLPRAVIRTVAVEIVPFGEVSAAHARAEGEDDRSLRSWRRTHQDFFTRYARHDRGFSAHMPVVCERFELVFPRPAPR
ncbi:ASCH domain-containing protein [Brevibacterium litoralis]|uniref:ASCH domain-containing protein n=1 Tax=Brevibacterium litoralis TaxID=3138935 RepID=UPI0032EF29F2